jgi:anti-anti-sigma regulatory factor
VTIVPGETGVTVSVVFEPSDRALPADETVPLRTRWDGSARPGVLVVTGPINAHTQEQFRLAVAAASFGDRPVVDLSGVTALNGAAIGVLNRHRAELAAVFVAEDSVIARALSYAGFSRWVPVLAGPAVGAALAGEAAGRV